MLLGLDRRVAAEFSFLVAVPVMFAATGAEIVGNLHVFTPDHLAPFLVGFVVSFLVAIVAVRGFMSVLGRVSLRPFAVYRILLGVVVLVAL
jgi:undecaprenyl-diphosphatase